MDFTLTEEQRMLRDLGRRFADEELRPRAATVDEKGEISQEVLQKAGEMGMTGAVFPEEYDGGGFGEVGYCLMMEELARGCMSTAIVIGGHESIGAQAIYLAGSHEQKVRYLKPLARGELWGAFALTEPQAGSDAAAMTTFAAETKGGFILNGQKTFITNGGLADVYVVFALTEKGIGTKGVSAFIVEKGFKGFRAGPPEKKMGIRGSPTTDLFFEDMFVPVENLLGDLGGGFKIAMETLDVGRLSVAAICLGVAKEAQGLSLKHSRERIQFGKPIGEQQAVKWMLADMAASIYALDSILYRTAHLCDQKKPFIRESAICKLLGSEYLGTIVDHAVQIHGGMGYMAEFPIERMYRDARITRIFEGTNEIQRLIIAGHLLKSGKYEN